MYVYELMNKLAKMQAGAKIFLSWSTDEDPAPLLTVGEGKDTDEVFFVCKGGADD